MRCFFQQHMAAVAICLANQLRPVGITDMVQSAQHAPASQIKHDVDWHELTVNGFDKCRHVGLGQIRTPDKGLTVKTVELSAEVAGIHIVIALIDILQARGRRTVRRIGSLGLEPQRQSLRSQREAANPLDPSLGAHCR